MHLYLVYQTLTIIFSVLQQQKLDFFVDVSKVLDEIGQSFEWASTSKWNRVVYLQESIYVLLWNMQIEKCLSLHLPNLSVVWVYSLNSKSWAPNSESSKVLNQDQKRRFKWYTYVTVKKISVNYVQS